MEVNVALRSVEVATLNTMNWEVTIWQRQYMKLARVTAGNKWKSTRDLCDLSYDWRVTQQAKQATKVV